MLTRLLVVDDDAATLLGLSEALHPRLSETHIETASSAERALILMALERFDIILSDVRMPGMDGVTFLKEIKALCPETIVLLMSGCATERRDEALRLGAWDFVEKPFVLDSLVASLQRAIRDCQLLRDVRESNKQSVNPSFKRAS
jgi:DNA-binding NtrC family response regulator